MVFVHKNHEKGYRQKKKSTGVDFSTSRTAEIKVQTSRRTARHKQAEYHHTNLPQKKCNSNFLRLKGSLLTLFSSTDRRKTN